MHDEHGVEIPSHFGNIIWFHLEKPARHKLEVIRMATKAFLQQHRRAVRGAVLRTSLRSAMAACMKRN